VKNVKIIGGATHLVFRAPFILEDSTLLNFGADGVLIHASNSIIRNVNGILPTNLIPYSERHPDFLQFVPLDDSGKVDPYGVIENVIIENVYLYAPDIPEKGFRGCQGITSFEGKLRNVVIKNFVILTDVEQHGLTIISAHHCTFVNGIIDSIRTEEMPGIVLSNRKGTGEGEGTRAKNILAGYKEVVNLKEEDIIVGKRDLSIRGLAEKEGINYLPLLALKNTESRVAFRLGQASMLFERHKHTEALIRAGYDIPTLIRNKPKFTDIIGYTNYRRYGTYQKQIDRFNLAAENDITCACESVSLGAFQIGVWHWRELGYADAQHMYEDMQTIEGQNQAFIKFVTHTEGLKEALNSMDIPTIKRLYNGSKFLDRDHNGIDDWTDNYTKELARVLGREVNPDKKKTKSTTITTEAAKMAGDVIKGGILTTVLANGETVIEVTKATLDQVVKIKDTLNENKILIDGLRSQVDALSKDMDLFNYIIIFLLILIVLKLFGGIKTIRNYLYDRGYTKHKEAKDVFWTNNIRK
jgi:hypothetical protein